MKKTIAILTALFLAVLCCVTAQAETEEVIRFLDIPWGSDVETVCQALLDADWINGEGVERMNMIEEMAERSRMRGRAMGADIPVFTLEDGHVNGRDRDVSRNAVSSALMSGMVTKEWMGIEVHNIELIFALEGKGEKLVSVIVSLMVNREDRRPELEEIYGKPDDEDEEYRRSAYWEGQEGTVLYYGGSEVIYSLKDAKEQADAAVMEIIETPTPVPTPEPTPEPTPASDLGDADVMSFVKKGELTFLDIPWDTDTAGAMDRMAALGFFTEASREKIPELKSDYPSGIKRQGSFWASTFPSADTWEAYFLWADRCEFTKTCFGYPVTSATVSFKKDGDTSLFKCIRIQCAGVGDAESVLWAAKTQLGEVLGEAVDNYGSYYWEGENDTVIYLGGSGEAFSVCFGISTEE